MRINDISEANDNFVDIARAHTLKHTYPHLDKEKYQEYKDKYLKKEK